MRPIKQPLEDGAMPDTVTETPTPTAPQPVSTPAPPKPDEPLGDGGKAALEAERTARKAAEKAAKDLEARLQAIEDKDKTELERIQARNAELEKNYATAEAQRLRLQIATAHSIPAEDLIFLTGSTEDELTAQAAGIAAKNAGRAAATAPPAFVPSPAQAAGNGTPPSPAATVAAGRDLYKSKNTKTA